MMQQPNFMVPPPMDAPPQYHYQQQPPPQQAPWPQYQVPPPQPQNPADGYYYQQPPQQPAAPPMQQPNFMVPPPQYQYQQQPPPQQAPWPQYQVPPPMDAPLQYHYQQQPPPRQAPWPDQYQVPPPQPQNPAAGYYYEQPPQQPEAPPMQQQYAAPEAQQVANDRTRNLWIEDLQYWMDEQYLHNCFGRAGEVVSAKIIRNKHNGQSEGYGFIEFASHAAAEWNLRKYSGTVMPSTVEQKFRLSWASMSAASYQTSQGAPSEDDDPNNTTVFVGNLDSNVTGENLRQVFGQYGHLLCIKIPVGNQCGFVQFADRSCAKEAIRVLNETHLGGQSVRLSWGTSPANKQSYGGAGGYVSYAYAV